MAFGDINKNKNKLTPGSMDIPVIQSTPIHLTKGFEGDDHFTAISDDPVLQPGVSQCWRETTLTWFVPSDLEWKPVHPVHSIGYTLDVMPGGCFKGDLLGPWDTCMAGFEKKCICVSTGVDRIPRSSISFKDEWGAGDPPCTRITQVIVDYQCGGCPNDRDCRCTPNYGPFVVDLCSWKSTAHIPWPGEVPTEDHTKDALESIGKNITKSLLKSFVEDMGYSDTCYQKEYV